MPDLPSPPAPPVEDLADRLDGLLFCPVTPFDGKGAPALGTYRDHVRAGVAGGPAAVLACCGTGEFPALDPDEYAACVTAAVEAAEGRVPVVAGVGYGTATAVRYARSAGEAGAEGLLVLPPYLDRPGQAGLARHYLALADACGLDLVVSLRDNAVLTPATAVQLSRHPRIIGFEDGVGDIDLLQRVIGAVRADGRELLFVNGLPLAEMAALAYRGIGVEAYTSAVYAYAPRLALTFFWALRAGDDATVRELLDGFYRPLAELRERGAGYAVALTKAAVRLTGRDVGEVRPPLVEPSAGHLAELAALIERGSALADAIESRTEQRNTG